jgi:hypothetical protein
MLLMSMCIQFSVETIYGVDYVHHNSFCMFRKNKADVFVFTPETEELRRFSFDFHEASGYDHLLLACPLDVDEMVLLPFASDTHMYVLHVPNDLVAENINLVEGSPLLQEWDEPITLAGPRYCSASVKSQGAENPDLHMHIYMNASLRTLAGYTRLGTRDHPDQSCLKVRLPYESYLPNIIWFDEWAGVIAVVTSRYIHGQFPQEYVTILRVKNPRDDVDPNSPPLSNMSEQLVPDELLGESSGRRSRMSNLRRLFKRLSTRFASCFSPLLCGA